MLDRMSRMTAQNKVHGYAFWYVFVVNWTACRRDALAERESH